MADEANAAAPGEYTHWFSTVKVLVAIGAIAYGTYYLLQMVAPNS